MSLEIRSPQGFTVAPEDLQWSFTRSSGPGGQHANTSDTAVTVRLELTNVRGPQYLIARICERSNTPSISISVSSSRSQYHNRREALQRLQQELELLSQPRPVRQRTRLSRAVRQRRSQAKQQSSRRKDERRNRFDD
ncbi:MAG: peptide chain release factor-like protein [Acidimicrobiales bacterium]